MDALNRTLKFWQLTIYGVGTIIGAGIYSVLGEAAGMAASDVWISVLLAGTAALLAAFSYAELASMYPRAGAEYHYARAAFPRIKIIAFVAGYLIALNAAATSATVALAFGGYWNTFVDWPVSAVALGLLIACTVISILGIRHSTWVGIALIAVQMLGLLMLVVAGFVTGDPGRLWEEAPTLQSLPAVLSAAALLFFMFIGFEDLANLAEETQDPSRNVPRALVLAVVITTAIYLLVCFAALALALPDHLASSDSPLATAGAQAAPWLGKVLTVTALFATASTALITLVSISRLLFGMAREHDLPALFARLLPARKTPWLATLGLFTGACALLPLGEVKITASVSALGVLLVFATMHATVLYLRVRQPDKARPFRLRVCVRGLPVSAVVGLLVSLAFATQFDPIVYGVLVIWLVIGAGLYLLARWQR